MLLSVQNIQVGCGATADNAAQWLPSIQAACDAYQINTPLRVAAFLATIGVESECLTAVSEDLDYSAQALADTWPARYAVNGAPNALAISLARNPQAIANNTYANENGNGDVASGDGWLYRGQGLIEITGLANCTICGIALNLDLVNHPELLQVPANAAMSAAWFWGNGNLNPLADSRSITAISKYVNCGNANSSVTPNGMPERLTLYNAGCASLGV